MRKISILSFIIAFFLVISPVFAQTYTAKRCILNTTLQVNNTWVVTLGGVEGPNFTLSKSVNCVYGCDDSTKDCNPSPFITDLWLIGGIGGIIVFICIVIWVVKKL